MSTKTMSHSTDQTYAYPPVTEELLAQIVDKIRSVGNPLKIVLFGSRARGDYKPDSDLDIMIIEESEEGLKEQDSQYLRSVSGMFPEITLLVYSLRHVEQWKFVPSYISTTALRQGKVLFEDDRYVRSARSSPDGTQLIAEEEIEYKTPTDLARDWFRRGNEDIEACRILLGHESQYGLVCFHAEQAIEKYLKGFLGLLSADIKKTHELDDLVGQCISLMPMPELEQFDLEKLSSYAVAPRYDSSFCAAVDVAEQALENALKVREIVLAHVPPEAHPERK